MNDRPELRVGTGFDAHPLVLGRRLVLAGVEVPWSRGLHGHSDADVACHALMDALLGAAALGDLGQHFPPGNPAYAGAASVALLQRVAALLHERGWRTISVDVTIIAEQPKLAAHIPAMRRALARALGVESDVISVKATSTNGLGFVGRIEGLAAQAVALIERSPTG